jgi:hypothetical protein
VLARTAGSSTSRANASGTQQLSARRFRRSSTHQQRMRQRRDRLDGRCSVSG